MKTRNLLLSGVLGVLGVPGVPNTEKASSGAACSDGTPNPENENTNTQEHQRCSKCLTDEEHAELKYFGFITPKAEHPRLPLARRPVLAVPYLVKAISVVAQ
ncbi:hypothetical protein [Pokkaliibacter plantistimulans]|uniref:hypothetical protein n=1 Tax=Pokkaliibacter plantistimulans TaxID=1635171 RepID=UPI00105807A7|nr:hypothetical protein [Pokkaliibacter plantistimulans]